MATPIHNVHWTSAARTHVGKVRKLNEDALHHAPNRGVWAVADGMGGHAAGDYASATLVNALADIREGHSLADLAEQTRETVERINGQLVVEGRRRRARIIGSTIAILLARGPQAVVMWAGDSRVYRLAGRQLDMLTRDHSRIQELIASGQLKPEEAEQHPEANVITRAVGVSETLDLDREAIDVRDGDTFLLCSDGLSRYVDDAEIARALREPSCELACERLVEATLRSPARDNVTVIVARASSDDSVTRTQINPNPMGSGPGSDLDDGVTQLDPKR